MTKETVGAASQRLLRAHNPDQTVIDTQREIDKGYFDEILKVVDRDPAKGWTEPYYIVVLTKKERIMENVLRRYFFARRSLPGPTFDQTVWRYYPAKGDLEFLWVLPDKETAAWMQWFPQDVPAGHEALIGFVNDFVTDKLYIKHAPKELYE